MRKIQRKKKQTKIRRKAQSLSLFWKFPAAALKRRRFKFLGVWVMGDEKSSSSSSIVMASSRDREPRDRELLIPVADSGDEDLSSKPSSSSSSSHHLTGRETFYKVFRSWASKKFMTGCVILFPIAITFYITWWFIHFVDGFFSPIYAQLGINIFGLGFVTSITFIFLLGCSCHHGWVHLSWVSVSGLSKECHSFVISTMPPSRLVPPYPQIKTCKPSRKWPS